MSIATNPQSISFPQDYHQPGKDAEEEIPVALVDKYKLPVTHEISLKDHQKTISSLGIDPSGSRLVSGSYDYTVKYWDFHGMTSNTFRPFRSLQPCGDYSIRRLVFSQTGDRLLVVPNASICKIFDRDGHELISFPKGDQYLMDMKNTSGHTAAINDALWHPNDMSTFVTGGQDATIRIWDANDKKKQKAVILVKRHPSSSHGTALNATKCPVTALVYTADGKSILSGSEDGIIRFWSNKGPHHRPTHVIDNAHLPGSIVTSLSVSKRKPIFLSRASDDTLKIWDSRQLKAPVHVYSNLVNEYPETNCSFSPLDDLIVTLTSQKKQTSESRPSELLFFDSVSFEPVYTSTIANQASGVWLTWHEKLNQIALGKNDGAISVLYSPDHSSKGAKLCLTKTSTQRDFTFVDADISKTIYTPHSLPLFRNTETKSLKRQREKDRLDPSKSHRPELPILGPGKGGKIGSNLTQHIMKNIIKDTSRDVDPREALLKYAKMAEENPMFVAHAYKNTQPVTLFSTLDEAEGEEDTQKK